MDGIDELASIPAEERAKVYCTCVRSGLLYGVETWALTEGLLASCDHKMLRSMSRGRLQDRINY